MAASLARVVADLHLHTVASACAEVEMIPPLIVRQAVSLGLDLIAVTDHHSVENVEAVQQAGRPHGIAVLPGMEVQSREEVHVVCLFETLDQARSWQDMIWARLPSLPNREEFFGPQYVVDAEGLYVRTNERLLQTSTDLGFDELIALADQWRVLIIPAHVDRPTNSLFANLGFIPKGVCLTGAEISGRITADEARQRFPELKGLGLVQSGDAHRLSEMINRLSLTVASRTVPELRMALLGKEGRHAAIR